MKQSIIAVAFLFTILVIPQPSYAISFFNLGDSLSDSSAFGVNLCSAIQSLRPDFDCACGFSLSCFSATATATQQSCSLSANPAIVQPGGSSTLSWELRNYSSYATTNFAISVTPSQQEPPAQTIAMDCSSLGYRYQECPLGVAVARVESVSVAQQYSYCNKLSPYDCKPFEGTNYGIKNGNVLWVDKGYRAKFSIRYIPLTSQNSASGTTIVTPPQTTTYELRATTRSGGVGISTIQRDCSSLGYRYQECPLGVPIERVESIEVTKQYSYCNKMSPFDCVAMEGTNYGIKNGNVLWVDKGYRANFKVTYVPTSSSSDSLCSVTVFVAGDSDGAGGSEGDGEGDAGDLNPAVCAVGRMCVGPDVYDQTAECSRSLVEQCPFGCVFGACISESEEGALGSPELSLTGAPPLIRAGGSCTVTASARNIASCTLTGAGISSSFEGVNGVMETVQVSTAPLSATQQVSFTCVNALGEQASRSFECRIVPRFQEI